MKTEMNASNFLHIYNGRQRQPAQHGVFPPDIAYPYSEGRGRRSAPV